MGLFCEHMYFVDDENFNFGAGRTVFGMFDEIADIIDFAAGRGVHFDDVDVATFVSHDTVAANVARCGSGTVFTNQGFGKNPCGRSFSRTAKTREKIGMRQSARIEGERKSLRDALLPDELFEASRTIFKC